MLVSKNRLERTKNCNIGFYLKLSLLLILFSVIHYALGYVPRIQYTIGIVSLLLILNYYRAIYFIFIFMFSFAGAVYFPVSFLYGSPSLTITTSLSYTNLNETIDFILSISNYLLLISSLILVIGYVCATFKLKIKRKVKIIAFCIFISVLLYGPIKDYKNEGYFNILNTGYPEVKFIKDFYYAKEETKKLFSLMSEKDEFQPGNVTTLFDTYVVVIGESARRDFMHAYGFPVNNTPFMSSANGILFTHYISAGATTQHSLINSLSIPPKIANNIISLAKKRGFITYWLSNQGAVGFNDTPIAAIGRKADYSFFLKKGNSSDSRASNDAELLPEIAKAINSSQQKKVIVIHLMGSHPRACSRTNGQYDTFYKNKEISCYVQSIKNTDKLLAAIHQYLTESHSKWSMMYFSDHGLGFSGKNNSEELKLIHEDRYKQGFEIPLFITAYNAKERQYITAQRSALNFFSLFSQWSGIGDNRIDNSCAMISNDKCKNQNHVLNFNDKLVDYKKLPIDLAP
ncbi:phosphoethanolamine transferase [Arsenophonus sp.]|uniref:phosphoethanolamine transferase n=1 Tax=Arsenophonus sp. TaxID=1872640 RepID=UPI003879FE4D